MDANALLATRTLLADMAFPERLSAFRKQRGLTAPQLAEIIGTHVSMVRRYETGKVQPTLDVIRRLALALEVSADVLVFDDDERTTDERLRRQFEATARLDDDEKEVVRTVIEGIILQHEAKRAMERAMSR